MSARSWVTDHAAELVRFGTVGALGVLVNLGTFNLLRLGPLSEDSTFLGAQDRVVTAKVIATLVSILFTWIAHRQWTFRGARRHRPLNELIIFVVVNLAALASEAGVLAISHYVLGFTSLLADNIASMIGIGVGTIARYAGYKLFVFSSPQADPLASDDA